MERKRMRTILKQLEKIRYEAQENMVKYANDEKQYYYYFGEAQTLYGVISKLENNFLYMPANVF